MNTQLFSFCLFLLWFSVAVFALLLGPIVNPRWFQDSSRWQFLGYGAILMALWNLLKWWSVRQRYRHLAYRNELEEAFRRKKNPATAEQQKPVVHPEFQFGEDHIRIPPPPPPNGTGH